TRREAFLNEGLEIPTHPSQDNYDLTFWDSNQYTDWQEVLVGKTANYSNYQAKLSGGSKHTQFFISGGYSGQTTVYPADFKNSNTSIRLILNHKSEDERFIASFQAVLNE